MILILLLLTLYFSCIPLGIYVTTTQKLPTILYIVLCWSIVASILSISYNACDSNRLSNYSSAIVLKKYWDMNENKYIWKDINTNYYTH